MDQFYYNGKWIIWLSFFIMIILEQMPWPEQFIYYRPTWLLLILIYWVIALPHRISVGTGFFLGILMDLIQGSTLSGHILAYSIICYVISYKYQILRNMELWQQSFLISGLSLLMNLIIYCTEFLYSIILFYPEIFWNCLINGILWPWIFLLLRKIRRHFLIY
ncbi:Rod shape-determining protein MreD [Candidatus Arsenophonus lipoptenae]|uniref:Rod shape-determining protein MreD n=1 Tax=Candidatus Arsenophonus lipoptenae TaxID=634113 RepID=A0A0X9W3A4_9GAMM|nr:rod shape-determining protein MreD [Candidatus Arsenophonus lipoptenae]AMA64999.1 Rod shape-determining protein MreD [Candidatus Arsenophonus lipoptenae]